METSQDRFTTFQNARALPAGGAAGGIQIGQKRIKRRYFVYVGLAVVAFFVFQLFFRYAYVNADGKLWRIDRLTQQSCVVTIGHAVCDPVPVSTSISTSTSTSLSVSATKR
jgi:hypothetical protein